MNKVSYTDVWLDANGKAPSLSLWNNESGLSCYRLTIPLELDCTGDVDVKIHYNWYGSTGFALIDPKFELQSV